MLHNPKLAEVLHLIKVLIANANAKFIQKLLEHSSFYRVELPATFFLGLKKKFQPQESQRHVGVTLSNFLQEGQSLYTN